ncbi:MAG: Gfo/Idh/MocA family oxidoreductase [Pseudomonadota bacterium]
MTDNSPKPASGPLRAGIAGAGVFGGYHASKYVADPRVEFVGVFDPVRDHAEALCARQGGRAFEALGELLDAIDVLTVTSPAVFHHDAAHRALQAGKPVLVEKPIAATLDEARELVTLAAANALPLQVGHQERFVFEAMGLFQPGLPALEALEARRIGTPSARNLDVSVTLDLMIHDIDLVLALAGADPVSIRAEMHAERGGLADHITTVLTFETGLQAKLESSRVAAERARTMTLGYQGGAGLDVDFIAKTFDHAHGLDLNAGFADTEMARDSLGEGVKRFVTSVLDGSPVAVPGQAGLAALETALAIDAAAGSISRI